MARLCVFLFLSLFVFSCSSDQPSDPGSTTENQSTQENLIVVSYNVENLVDTKHDQKKGKDLNDWAFLPHETEGKKEACGKISYWRYRQECFETDWTEKKLKIKLSQIADVFNENSLPHILGLNEVENEKVVSKLAKVLGYEKFVVTDGPDERGVDVALLYRSTDELELTLLDSKEHRVSKGELFKGNPTRNILEARFRIGDNHVTFFVNHWPSQGGPSSLRVAAAEVLAERTRDIYKEFPGENLVAMGDFNTIPSDHPHPFHTILFKDDLFLDIHRLFQKSEEVSRKTKNSMPPGSYFYAPKMSWNLLDRFFIGQNLQDGNGAEVEVGSYRILAPKRMTETTHYKSQSHYLRGSKVTGTPKAYNHNADSSSESGYSDHFPIRMEISL